MSLCDYCTEPVVEGEQHPNFERNTLHFECGFRMMAGSAAHILGDCSCCGGTRHDPPTATLREGAKLALEAWRMTYPEGLIERT
jgi:hypothetical protein